MATTNTPPHKKGESNSLEKTCWVEDSKHAGWGGASLKELPALLPAALSGSHNSAQIYTIPGFYKKKNLKAGLCK